MSHRRIAGLLVSLRFRLLLGSCFAISAGLSEGWAQGAPAPSKGSPAPSIGSISPKVGPTSGGTVVTINGSNFASGAAVRFGSINSPKVQFLSSSVLKATAPPHAAEGVEGITVTNPDGQTAGLPVSYTYHVPPSLLSVSPTNGPSTGGATVVVTGTSFRAGATVQFGGIAATSVIFDNNTQLRAAAPPHALGVVDVVVINPDGLTATLPAAYAYRPKMTITGVSPNIGPTAGGTSVTVDGSNFIAGAGVTLGGSPAASVTFVSSTQLVFKTPAHTGGRVDLTVKNPSGDFATFPQAFTFSPGPIIYSVSPDSGVSTGGTTVALTGANLKTVSQVRFGATPGIIVSTAPSVVTVTTPALAGGNGNVDIVVTNPNGTFTVSGGFHYTMEISTNGLDDGYPGIPYQVSLTATGGVLPYKWSVSSGQLPAGLSLGTSSGILSGTPGSTYGTYNVTIHVADSSTPPLTSTAAFTFNILFGFKTTPIPSSFFGMILYDQFNWPSVTVGALGKGLATTWPFIEQVKGTFNWTVLDEYVNQAQSHGVTIYWTNANIPPWAAADPSTCSFYAGSSIQACTSMVKKIQDFDDFMTALVLRYKGKIQTYELWNEPNVKNVYTGTMTDLVTLTQHAYADIRQNDPNATITSPSPTAAPFLQNYFTAGGPTGVDAIAIHGYPDVGVADVPEAIVGFKSLNVKLAMLQLGLQSKPIIDTESSWGGSGSNQDPDFRAAFASRFLLLHWSVGIPQFYWYGWDSPQWGTLWSPSGGISPAGVAYQQTYNWMLGASMPHPCSQNGGTVYSAVYTCDLTRPGGYLGRAVWDTTQSCSGGACTTSTYTPAPGFIRYRDLQGNVFPIAAGQTIKIGAKPILLEN
jgi:IPT/TIG domain/Putative Ig domain